MSRSLTALALVVVIGLATGCAQQAPPVSVDDAWSDLQSAYREVESAEEKTRLAEDFLNQYPGSEHAGWLTSVVAYYRGDEMDDKAGAYSIINDALAHATEPEARFDVQMALFPLAHELGHPADLGAVADELATHQALNFSQHQQVMEMATEHELWQVAESQAETALTLATPEAYRADREDDEISDEEAAAKADHRKVLSLAHQGWAMANTERASEALEVFESAAELSTSNYLGVPKTDLYRFWGLTALAQEDFERAMELLATTAVMGDSEEALEGFRSAYAGKNGTEDGFDDFLWTERQRLAQQVDDFVLADYQGNEVVFATLKQDKVVLLTFWFPT